MKAGGLIALVLVLTAALITLRGTSSVGGGLPPAVPDFVVADSRDAGPGTLRDAILAADRSTSRVHILVKAKRIVLESALPAIINPHGVEIDAAPEAGAIDADRQASGVTLSINSQGSVLRGLRISGAHGSAIVVNAEGVQLDSITVSDSKIGILLASGARGCSIRNATFEHDETGLTAEGDARNLSVASSIFRGNTRAGIWLVGAPEKDRAAGTDAERDGREGARIVDSVFEKNTSGVVIGNRPVWVQKSRFLDSRESAVVILGGVARIEDSEIRGSGTAAISVTSGTAVILARNTLMDNASMAILIRDSDVSVDHNTLRHNALGIVSIISRPALAPAIRDNTITQSGADAITLIGGSAVVQRNQILDNHGAGLKALDLVADNGQIKAAPRLEENVLKGNAVDSPVSGVYKLSGTL
jgi:parallel beta helix pectate lyase-like protein/copper-binding protein NosD